MDVFNICKVQCHSQLLLILLREKNGGSKCCIKKQHYQDFQFANLVERKFGKSWLASFCHQNFNVISSCKVSALLQSHFHSDEGAARLSISELLEIFLQLSAMKQLHSIWLLYKPLSVTHCLSCCQPVMVTSINHVSVDYAQSFTPQGCLESAASETTSHGRVPQPSCTSS